MNIKNFNWTKMIDISVATLLVIGGLNWGLVGLFHVDLIAEMCGRTFGETNLISQLIYSLIGVAAGFVSYQVFSLRGLRERWHIPPHQDPKASA